MPEFTCPSSPDRLPFTETVATVNYAGNAGISCGWFGADGPFESLGTDGRYTRTAEVTDGPTRTLAFSEVLTGKRKDSPVPGTCWSILRRAALG